MEYDIPCCRAMGSDEWHDAKGLKLQKMIVMMFVWTSAAKHNRRAVLKKILSLERKQKTSQRLKNHNIIPKMLLENLMTDEMLGRVLSLCTGGCSISG